MLMKLKGLYLRILALPLGLLLYIVGWKKAVLSENRLRCGVCTPFFRLRFYAHVALDLVCLMHGVYGQRIRILPRDIHKLKNLKSSSLFLTAHFHNWELLGAWMTRQGIDLLGAARSMSHPLAQRLLLWIRSRLGLKTVFEKIPRTALRHLEQGGCFGMLWDQRPPNSEVRTAFFGHSVLVDSLPFFLLQHRPLPVWFGTLLPDGTFRLLLLASHPGSASRSLTPEKLARRYHRVLEVLVRRHPTWWYGMAHRRFRESSSLPSISGVSRETSTAPEVERRKDLLKVSRETLVHRKPISLRKWMRDPI
jgi:hypothetical protein